MFKVKNIMKTNVIYVTKDTPINKAIELLRKNNITGMPVVNEDKTLAGIISEKDVVKLLYTPINQNNKVENYMTKKVIAFDHEASIISIADCFIKNNFRRVPILANGKVVGIISRKDVISYILEMQQIGEAELALITMHQKSKS